MEAIAFAVGLDPILTRGQQLVDQFSTWQNNKELAPELIKSCSSFEKDLVSCNARLLSEAQQLPEQSRTIIEADISSLDAYLKDARVALQSLKRRLGRSPVLQLFRANAFAKDCHTLSAKLKDARELLREASKYVDLRSGLEDIKMHTDAELTDQFRPSFPPIAFGIQAVLDFETGEPTDSPSTPEGRIKGHLLQETVGSPKLISIHGIGGVGKSTIVKVLALDREIRGVFKDGVHVIKLGKDATVATLFGEICRVLRDSGAHKTEELVRVRNDIDEVLSHFERWFEGKKCAFLVDDIWVQHIGIGLFSRLCGIGNEDGENSVLLTTREHEVASLAPSDKIIRLKPEAPRAERSRRILLLHADQESMGSMDDSVREAIDDILDVCAGLPVSLAAAGKNVKKMRITMAGRIELAWPRYASQLIICRDSLLRKDVESYGSLFATFATAIAFLDQEAPVDALGFETALPSFGALHRRFCVFQKQAMVSAEVLRHLWKTESDVHAEMIATAFTERGLADSEVIQVGSNYEWRLSLHDSLHDFAMAEASRLKEKQIAHDDLLTSYGSFDSVVSSARASGMQWWSRSLKPDGYVHRNLCRHLREAGRRVELLNLLMTPQWAERQLELNDILALDADFTIGIKAIGDGLTASTVEDAFEAEAALSLISEATRLSSSFITARAEGLWFQLYGRLKGREERLVQEYLRSMRKNSRGPLLLLENDLLGEAGGPNRKIISLGAIAAYCIVLNRDGEEVVCGCHEGSIAVVSLHDGIVKKEWKAHKKGIGTIALGRNGSRIVSGCEDGIAKVWDFKTCLFMSSFEGHTDKITKVEVSKDGRHVISGSADGSVQIWELDSGRIISQPIMDLESWITSVALMGGGDIIVTMIENSPKMWSSATGNLIGPSFDVDGHDEGLESMALTPDEQSFVAGSMDGSVRIWDAVSHQLIGKSMKGHSGMVSTVAVSDDGCQIVSGSSDETICVWDLESMQLICPPLKGHTSMVTGVSFLANSNLIVSCSIDRTVRLWDIGRSKEGRVSHRHMSAVIAAHFTSDGKYLITGGNEGTLCVRNAKTGEPVRYSIQAHDGGWIYDVAVAPSGRYAVSTAKDRSIRMWDLESGELLGSTSTPDYKVYALAFTPHGNRVVAGASDQTVRIWDLETLTNGDSEDEVHDNECDHVILNGHCGGVSQVFVSDDGMRIISIGGEDIFVWELDTGKLLKETVGVAENAWILSRREALLHVGETTILDRSLLSISRQGYELLYGEEPNVRTLARFGVSIVCWAISPDQKTVCVGLLNGQFALMQLTSQEEEASRTGASLANSTV